MFDVSGLKVASGSDGIQAWDSSLQSVRFEC